MRFYLDCEFHDMGDRIDLWSIAIVCEDGRSCYLALDFDESTADEWLKSNVLPHLAGMPRYPIHNARQIIAAFMANCLKGSLAEFWGYYCAHDWFLLCRLFGGMMKLPSPWGMYCREMMQLNGSSDFNCGADLGAKAHSALFDAQWMRDKHAEVLAK